MSLKQLIQRLVADGTDVPVGPNMGKFLGFPNGADSKYEQVEPDDTTDGLQHNVKVVLDRSTEGSEKPVCLIVIGARLGPETSSNYFRLTLEGKPALAFRFSGRNDENGRAVRGSGVKTDLDLNDPEVKASLQRELDFWLKGKGRKKAARGG